jgi:hypothetical protein
MDAKTTFLNEDLKDEVYMKQSKGFINNSQKNLQIKEFYLWTVIDLSLVIYFYKVNVLLFIENLVN